MVFYSSVNDKTCTKYCLFMKKDSSFPFVTAFTALSNGFMSGQGLENRIMSDRQTDIEELDLDGDRMGTRREMQHATTKKGKSSLSTRTSLSLVQLHHSTFFILCNVSPRDML